jgi:hypothetical protein
VRDQTKKPVDFDWVTARKECSIQDVFEALRLLIRENVETHNGLFAEDRTPAAPVLKVSERGNLIRVYWHDMYGQFAHLFVEFKLNPVAISVRDHENVLFEATVGLNDDGDCKVNIHGKQYDFWQVSRKALERLMFEFPQ